MTTGPHARAPRAGWLRRVVDVRPGEPRGLGYAFGCAFTMFFAYSMLRPVREAMGIDSGVANLPMLFWATFACSLVLQPVYGWVVSRFSRAIALPRIYAFFAATLVMFYVWFLAQADHTWVARCFFVWISIFNLFVVAVFWSLMADIFTSEQAGRLFGFIASGLSAGGLLGPLVAGVLAPRLGRIQLLVIAAALMLLAARWMHAMIQWHRRHAALRPAQPDVNATLPGGAFAAFGQVLRTPYLRAVALFVLLLTSVSTALYLEQQRVVAHAALDPDARTVLFARIDFTVQALSLFAQAVLFSRLLRRFGFTTMLAAVPALVLLVFAVMASGLSFELAIGAIVVRRVGEYGVTRPCRDMLMSVISRPEKYKAKHLIDTFIYRGGDGLSASLLTALAGSAIRPLVGVGLCGAWLITALWLGRRFEATVHRGQARVRSLNLTE
jgi:ATP:ADP antiporter, AAA family